MALLRFLINVPRPFLFLLPLRNAHEAQHRIRVGVQVRTQVGVDGDRAVYCPLSCSHTSEVYVMKADDDDSAIKGVQTVLLSIHLTASFFILSYDSNLYSITVVVSIYILQLFIVYRSSSIIECFYKDRQVLVIGRKNRRLTYRYRPIPSHFA